VVVTLYEQWQNLGNLPNGNSIYRLVVSQMELPPSPTAISSEEIDEKLAHKFYDLRRQTMRARTFAEKYLTAFILLHMEQTPENGSGFRYELSILFGSPSEKSHLPAWS
jgi:hypothetical protein